MFVVLLKFTHNGDQAAARHREGHNVWLKHGFDAGVFLLAGSMKPGVGGAIIAHNTSLSDLRARLQQDPFVAAGVVSPEIIEITPARLDPRLGFLLA